MKVVVMSDTHSKHERIDVPDGDVLIHCGDFCSWGSPVGVRNFAKWLETQPHEHKIVIAGNHEKSLEGEHQHVSELYLREAGALYLRDSTAVIEDVTFYGSPWQPAYFNWAFNLPRGRKLAAKWAMIPADTDVLITHGPPKGVLDANAAGSHVGCKDLMKRVEVVQPRFHVFGHIHEAYGQEQHAETTFINAAICNLSYKPVNQPVVFEISK